MGFSYVAAVAILLSSSLIFFGIIYSDYVHSETQLSNAQNDQNRQMYDYINSKVKITGYDVSPYNSVYNVTINMTNTGSISLDLMNSNLLLNGSLENFSYSAEYLLPMANGSVSFQTTAGNYQVEIAFNTGYNVITEVKV
ncbi:flagellar protein F [Oxyplasma meridianum]|uniref:Flagellar protein F n=1 Tax=Oxyplasma meridianum TaxID=3073602 RepID=A0AAX4NEK8_9ARCH